MNSITRKERIVILGGGYAGVAVAARVARLGERAAVTLVDDKDSFTQRIRLHETLAGGSPRSMPYTPMLRQRDIRFLQGRAEHIDTDRQRVSIGAAGGSRTTLEYDTLIFALGSTTGAPVHGVAEHTIRLNDPASVRSAAAEIREIASNRGRVLVAGAGLTGIETASELAERYPGLRVTMVASGSLDTGYSPEGARHLKATLNRLGIELLEHRSISAIDNRRAFLEDGSELPFDSCVWAGGFQPPALARESGLSVDAGGQLQVTDALQVVSFPNIFAAGDSAGFHAPWGKVRMGCVSAMPMGSHVGDNIVRLFNGEPLLPFRFGIVIRCISLGRRDGLVQFTRPDDQPIDRTVRGWGAAHVKELICKGTFVVPRLELSTGLRLNHWFQPEPEAEPLNDISETGLLWKHRT